MKITDYKILKDERSEGLESEVKEYIKNGWQPYGDLICVVDIHCNHWYRQAMVKYE